MTQAFTSDPRHEHSFKITSWRPECDQHVIVESEVVSSEDKDVVLITCSRCSNHWALYEYYSADPIWYYCVNSARLGSPMIDCVQR